MIAFLIIGIAAFFNVVIIIHKLNKKRYVNGVIDGLLLIAVMILFSGSYGALVVGTIASALISIYLNFVPLKFLGER